jgi:hypothetical protein
MIEAIAGIGTAFGLSGSAGLNAYIPLLIVALAGRFPAGNPLIELTAPYDLLTSWWAIGVLVVLLLIEVLVDKIPAVDTLNDGIQTFVRPAAGAILFAGSTSAVGDMNPILAVLAGVLVAGGVHATKGLARPVVTASTAGTGNWAVSLGEDLLATTMSLFAIFIPVLAGILVIIFTIAIILLIRRIRQGRKGARI